MRNLIRIILAFMFLMPAHMLPADAAADDGPFGHRKDHLDFGLFVGPGWWGHGFWYPSPHYPYYPYYPQGPANGRAASETNGRPAAQTATPYLYFCPERNGYYPFIRECPRSWVKRAPLQPSTTRDTTPGSPPPH